MDEAEEFRSALWGFVGRQPSKKAAADTLKITRTDLYRYLSGDTAPRQQRRDEMMQVMHSATASHPAQVGQKVTGLSSERVTDLRDTLLHLASLLDLDLASRHVNERKGG